jgi:hypothetical protein
MVRTQLYLPDELYKSLKKKAKAKDMSFAAYVRVYLEGEAQGKNDEKSKNNITKAFPFLKFAGTVEAGKNASNNDELDKFVYGL